MRRERARLRDGPVRKSGWRHVRRLFWLAILLLLFSPVALLMAVSDDRPLVQAARPPGGEAAARARKLASVLRRDIAAARSRSALTIGETDANALMGLATRAFAPLRGHVNIAPSAAVAAASLHLPQNPFGEYVNVRAWLLPSSTGLALGEVEVGALSIPGGWVERALRAALNMAADNDFGDALFGSVYAVHMRQGAIEVQYGPVRDLLAQTGELARRGRALRDELKLLGEPEVTRAHFRHLCDTAAIAPRRASRTLGSYLSWAFEYARERTAGGRDAVKENRGALLAVSILLGNRNFETLTGPVRAEREPCDEAARRVTVAGRGDLRLHYVISAAFELLSDAGVSFALGEFKELTDSGRGGSGFSFVDLAADRAGLRFATLALSSRGAGLVQRNAELLAMTPYFFPPVDDLREGLPAHVFEREYGGVEGAGYTRMVALIDARIDKLALFEAAR